MMDFLTSFFKGLFNLVGVLFKWLVIFVLGIALLLVMQGNLG